MATDPEALRAKKDKEAENIAMVREFYRLAITEKDVHAARQYMGPYYTQHNPDADDGPEGLAVYVEWLKVELADLRVDHKRIMADGDFVILHSVGANVPMQMAVIDIFRVENGKVVEHWDVLEPYLEPGQTRSGNEMV